MKTILVATDFTPSSVNACLYAATLAKKLTCKLTLFNLFEIPAVHSNSGLYLVSYNSVKENSEETIKKLAENIHLKFPKLHIDHLVTTGSFKRNIEEFIAAHQVEAVVMGLATKTKLSKFIYGSHSTDIAGKIKAPVIIVPEKYKKYSFKNILLGVDNTEKLYKSELIDFESLVKDLKSSVKLVHLRTDEEVFKNKPGSLNLNGKSLKVNTFFAKDMQDGIKKYVKKTNTDLIAVISKSHSAFYELFAETNTKKIAFSSKIPVLCIHE